MQKNGLISIIMPVYNCAEYLKQSIGSVKLQTYTNWELIIVNDNSKDNSIDEIYKNTEDIKEKVKVINLKTNGGAARCRNIGLENTSGRYIAYFDADDVWKEDKLEKEISFMKENDVYFAYTNFEYIKHNKNKKVRKMPNSLNYKQALKNTFILTSTVMIDTKHINKKLLVMPNVKRGQDMATWWQILKAGNIAYGLNQYLTLYRRDNETSLSHKKFKAVRRTWNLYRNVEKFNVIKSLYYFVFYACNAVKKRI